MNRQKVIINMALMVCMAGSIQGQKPLLPDSSIQNPSPPGRLGGVSRSGGASSQGASFYGGIEGGMPFGFSTFSSFGADKTRAGYAFGLFGGYRFNPVLSADFSMKRGKVSLSTRDCCVQSGYWLGADGITYHSPVAGMDGQDYSALKSDVSLQQYGIRLNVNLLGLFKATRQSRWTLEVSPVLAAVGTKATVKILVGGDNIKTRHAGIWALAATLSPPTTMPMHGALPPR